MASFWSKRINMRVKRQVAKDLNVDEEQVQELIDGKRHIGGETMDKVLQSINDEAENRIARDFEILDWYTNTDLKALRLEWGYGQKELANKLKINPITLNAVESKYSAAKNVTPNIQKLYDFYQNEFNKKIESKVNNRSPRERCIYVCDKNDEILAWYKNTNLVELRRQFGYGGVELAQKLGINFKTFNNMEHHTNDYLRATEKIQKLYNFYHDENNMKNAQLSEIKPIEAKAIVDEPKVVIDEPKEEIKANFDEDIIIRIDKNGNIIYSEYGKEITNITELHLDKVGDEKPVLDIKLRRLF